MTVLLEALFLAAMMVAAIFAGSDAWSADRATHLSLVVRPAVNLSNSLPSSFASSKEAGEISDARELTLAEIVDLNTIPKTELEPVLRHLRSIVLSDRPSMGEERTFTNEGLEAIVGEATRRLQAAGYAIDWKIPTRSHVLRTTNFDRETVTEMIRVEMSARCGSCEVVIRNLILPKVQMKKNSVWRLVFRSDRPRGSFAVPLEFDDQSMMITGDAELYAKVPVAQRAIAGAEKISDKDYKFERRNITYALDAPANELRISSSVASRNLAYGEPIWQSALRREQLVRFGDPVRVQIGGDSWSITSDGVAQGSATLGESVRVKVGKSQKLVSGVLKEKGLVEIQ